MRTSCRTVLRAVLILALSVPSGCGGGPGGEELDEVRSLARSEKEVWGFLPKPRRVESAEPATIGRTSEPELRPTPRPRPVRRPSEPRQLSGVLLRGGLLMTLAAKEGDWEPAASFGVGYRWADGSSASKVFDFGMDFATVEDNAGEVTSSLISLRGEVLFGKWNAWRSSTIVYLLGGAHVLLADSEWDTVDRRDAGAAAGFEFGVGLGASSGRWELRTVYSFLAGSQNVDGNLLIAAGFSL